MIVLRLCCSLRLHPDYDDFRTKLRQSLLNRTTTNDEMINAALEVLRTVSKADHSQVLVVNVDDALKILVDNAIEEFGFPPRDAYHGVFNLTDARADHDAVVGRLTYSQLVDIVRLFSETCKLGDISDRVVAIHPYEYSTHRTKWKMDFKSTRIRAKVTELMWVEEIDHLREMYSSLSGFSEGSSLVGWIFETMAHRMLSNGWRGSKPLPMKSNGRNPPAFTIAKSLHVPGTSQSAHKEPPGGPSVITSVIFTKDGVTNVSLEKGKYYKPAKANNPLFDSFKIDYNPKKRTVVISIFQATISPSHGGSKDGYVLIRKIMSSVRQLLKNANSNATLQVTYFLVCPDDGSGHQWQMPTSWGEKVTRNDHRGDVFCIRIPI